MNIDTAVLLHLQNLLGKDLTIGCNNHDVCFISTKLFDILRATDALRLENREAMLLGIDLDVRRDELTLPSPRLVGLGYHQRNLMSGFYQRIQCGGCEVRRSHEYNLHQSSSSSSSSP